MTSMSSSYQPMTPIQAGWFDATNTPTERESTEIPVQSTLSTGGAEVFAGGLGSRTRLVHEQCINNTIINNSYYNTTDDRKTRCTVIMIRGITTSNSSSNK